MNQKLIDKLIENGVKNLKEYGYPDVNQDNIFTDMIYSAFFKRMLKDSLEDETLNHYVEEVNSIIARIKTV